MKDERKYTVSNNSQNKILFSQVVLRYYKMLVNRFCVPNKFNGVYLFGNRKNDCRRKNKAERTSSIWSNY
jgi:hypothetical protein